MQQIIKQVVPLKYSKILNISQYNYRLSTTIIILLNLNIKKIKIVYLIVKPVTGLSIPIPILRLNFVAKLNLFM